MVTLMHGKGLDEDRSKPKIRVPKPYHNTHDQHLANVAPQTKNCQSTLSAYSKPSYPTNEMSETKVYQCQYDYSTPEYLNLPESNGNDWRMSCSDITFYNTFRM